MRRPLSSVRRPVRAPGFWLQGVLILLPALLLAGAGLVSLRQDRILAEHEARSLARQAATELAEGFVERLNRLDFPVDLTSELRSSNPEADPIRRTQTMPWIAGAFLQRPDGTLAFPAPLAPLPLPAPLDLEELSEEQRSAWLSLEAQFMTENADPTESEQLFAEFERTEPGERFLAVAALRLARAARAADQLDRAEEILEMVLGLSPELVLEGGLPAEWAAAWQLAEISPERARNDLINRLCFDAVTSGSSLSEALIERAAGLDPKAARWLGVWRSHQAARRFYEAAAGSPDASLVEVDGREWLLLIKPVQGATWVLGSPLAAVRDYFLTHPRASSRDVRFHFRVMLGDRPLLDQSSSEEPLAIVSRGLSVPAGEEPLRVEGWLANSAEFYAQQRSRSLRFGALIAASAVSVCIGFLAAWRAFRRQQQLSEMKTNFVSSVSHELRAPIASVRLMAEELAEGENPSREQQRQYHHFIGQECRRLSAVIENVLDFSRREQGREQFEFEPTDLGALIRETTRLMQAYGGERDVRLEVETSAQLMSVEADGQALHRLLVNLVDNAIKHAPARSIVRIGGEVTAAMTSLWVADEGPGIPPAEHEKIFERFYRIGSELRRETPGVGLGLSIVKHIAEVHGGTVRVFSSPGKGSRFVVELPLRVVEAGPLEGAARA